MRYILILLITGILFSCTPEKKLARLVKKHPELVKRDTVLKEIQVPVPGFTIDTSLDINPDYVKSLLQVIEKYSTSIDSLQGIELKREVINIVNNNSLIKDTMNFTDQGVTVKIWQQDGKVKVHISKPDTVQNTTVPVTVNNVTPGEEKGYLIPPWVFLVICCICLVLVLLRRS